MPAKHLRSSFLPFLLRLNLVGIALSVSALLVVLGVFTPLASADAIMVTRFDDPTPDGCVPADCSLREAIIAANANPGADTITLPAGINTLTIAGAGEDAGATGDLDITDDLTITGDGAAATIIDGGGLDRVFYIYNPSANLFVEMSGVTVRNGNSCIGGGIYNVGTLFLTSVAVSDNSSCSDGGGIFNAGTLRFLNGTLSGNVAGEIGGGIENDGAATLINVTVSGNTIQPTYPGGGAIANRGGAILSLNNVTVFGNTDVVGLVSDEALPEFEVLGAQTTVVNTIIAGDGPQGDCLGPLTSLGYNLIQDAGGCIIAGDTTGNVIGQDPSLGPLADNGGPTQTRALLPGSAAIDGGNPGGCTDDLGNPLTTDQRGFARPTDGDGDSSAICDIGAYEGPEIAVEPTPTPTPTPTASPTPTPTAASTLTPTPTAAPIITLDPQGATNIVGEDHTVTATVELDGQADVQFEVTDGPNAGDNNGQGTAVDTNGQVDFTYTGAGGAGTDTIQACVVDFPELCATATKTWVVEPTPTPTPTPAVLPVVAMPSPTPSPSPTPTPTPVVLAEVVAPDSSGGAGAGARGPSQLPVSGGEPADAQAAGLAWTWPLLGLAGAGLLVTGGGMLARRRH